MRGLLGPAAPGRGWRARLGRRPSVAAMDGILLDELLAAPGAPDPGEVLVTAPRSAVLPG